MASRSVKVICNDCHNAFENVAEAAYHHCKAKDKTLRENTSRTKEEKNIIESETFIK